MWINSFKKCKKIDFNLLRSGQTSLQDDCLSFYRQRKVKYFLELKWLTSVRSINVLLSVVDEYEHCESSTFIAV